VQVRDIILCTTDEEVDASHDEFLAHPPVGINRDDLEFPNAVDAVDLGRGIVLTALDDDEAETLMNACEPRGHFYRPHRQFSQRYAFVCNQQPIAWVGSNGASPSLRLLGDVLTLSRLVRDNGHSMQYASRIATFHDGSSCIVPLFEHEWKTAYRARRDRDWLDGAEADELTALLTDYWAFPRPERVDRALWRSEEGVRMQFLEPMLPFLTGGLEALLKTERHPSTRQFIERVPALAAKVGVEGVDRALCESVYDGRSAWVHGAPVQLFNANPSRDPAGPSPDSEMRKILAQVALLQDTLRQAIRRAIEDPNFRQIFEQDESIREAFGA